MNLELQFHRYVRKHVAFDGSEHFLEWAETNSPNGFP